MADGSIKLKWVHPDPASYQKLLNSLPEGSMVTSMSDSLLPKLKGLNQKELEVLALPEVFGRAIGMLGLSRMPQITRGELLAAAALACEDLPEDSPFYACRHFPGFHRRLDAVLREFRHAGLDSQRVYDASAFASPLLSEKLKSISQIIASVESFLVQMQRTTASMTVSRICEAPEKKLPFDSVTIFLGDDWSPDLLRYLPELAKRGVTVTVAMDYGDKLFVQCADAAELLRLKLPAAPKPAWFSGMFGAEPFSGPIPEIEEISTAEPMAEVEWALRECWRAIEERVAEHRIAILVPNTEMYAPLLRSAANRFGVRLDARIPAPLLTNGFAKFIRDLVTACAESDIRLIPKAFSTSYAGLNEDQRTILKTRVREILREGTPGWDELQQAAFDAELDLVTEVLQWRTVVMSESKSTAAWMSAIHELTTNDQIAMLALDSEHQKAADDRYAQNALVRAIRDQAHLLDSARQQRMSLREFARFAEAVWENQDMILPSSRMGIRVVSDPIQLERVDVLIALGTSEGVLPSRRSEDPILTDEERHEIKQLVPESSALRDSHARARQQRDRWIRLCAAPEKRLVLFWPLVNGDAINSPSSYIGILDSHTSGSIQKRNISVQEIVPFAAHCRIPFDLKIRQALDGPRLRLSPARINNPEIQKKIAPDLSVPINSRFVADASECAFRAVCRHEFRLYSERAAMHYFAIRNIPYKLDLLSRGTLQDAESALNELAKEMLMEASLAGDPALTALLESAIERTAPNWLQVEFGARELWPVDMNTAVVRPKTDALPLRDEVSFDGRTIRITSNIPGLVQIGGSWCIIQYGSERYFPKPERDLRKFLQYGLEFMLLARTPNPGFIIDSPTEGRNAFFFSPADTGLRSISDRKIRINTIEPGHKEFFNEVGREAKRSLRLLEQGDMRAVPGDYCKTCAYGELCRESLEFGEALEAALGAREEEE